MQRQGGNSSEAGAVQQPGGGAAPPLVTILLGLPGSGLGLEEVSTQRMGSGWMSGWVGLAPPPVWEGETPADSVSTAFETRCPNGKKVIQYKRAKLEKWAPYLNHNGLVSRLTTYEDLESVGGEVKARGAGRLQQAPIGPTGTNILEIKEWYQNREDRLELKHINKTTDLKTDYFRPGHPQALRVHSYKSMQPEMDRVIEFYETARVDGLIKREETPKTMTEHYQGRSDFLSYRHADFGPRVKKLTLSSAESNPRPIVKITERFFRNPAKPAEEDVAERVFLVAEERIQLRYHCREDHITASKREFLRLSEVDSKGNKIIMMPDMCITFEVEPVEHTKKLLYQYETLMHLKKEEKLSRHQVWESELEMLEILKLREEEEEVHTLTISIYDTKRNEKSKEYREAMVSINPLSSPQLFLDPPGLKGAGDHEGFC
ncbi:Dynein regulatory complex subunit 7 [Saguinus oedipus]|uniref:Dynein regulatory complex subunit 7 n=1 Tax=Saguinus oedipus TaxID=9490 RepID=A0ABQ9TK83_SAGOE|nr:Dynein regulatory complex subunit 7 [Saguinus oedipus]